MSLSTDYRVASLEAFLQARAMGSATNAGGGAITGASDCGRDEGGKFSTGNTCGIGIGINDSDQDFTGLILSGKKTTETRPTQSLKPWVGKTVGIVRTGKGKATLVGTMKIGEPKFYKTAKDFDADFDKHQVGKDSPHYIGSEGKYGYPILDVKPVEPIVLDTQGRVGRRIPTRVIYKSQRGMEVVYDLSGVESPEEPRAFCPTGDGGGVDNSCGISNSDGERIRGVRGKSDKIQTKVARKIYQMRTSEKQIKKLIRDLGGKVGNSLIEIDTTRGDEGINIFVRDREHNETHYIHMGYYGATIYTTDKATEGEMDSIKDAAREAFPKTIDKRLYRGGDEYPIEVVGDPTKTENTWGGLTAKQRLKAKLNARYASLLAFAEARDCGRDPDGKFSSGNTCASGALAEAAQGAAKGAVKGAITGLLAGGPATVKPGAAIGAATGAVKGIYDNQMRPTRVKRTIEKLGMTTEQVGSLVEKLGGTPNSSADTKGNSLRLTIRGGDGKKTFHVEVDSKTITVYPRRASGELSGHEISRLKKIADEETPKSISVVVKQSSSAYVAKLVKNGFTVAAGEAKDILIATYATPLVHSFGVDAVQSVKKKFSARYASLLAFAQSRGFCPTGEGGGIDNSCGSQGGGYAAASTGGSATYAKAKEIDGPRDFDSQAIAREIACDRFDETGELQKWAMGSRARQADVAAQVASVRLASKAVPEIAEARLNFTSLDAAIKSGMLPGVSSEQAKGVLGLTSMHTGEIRMIIDNPATPGAMRDAFKAGAVSTDHPAHAVVHEFAHHLQVDGYRNFLIEDVRAAISSGGSKKEVESMQQFVDHLEGGGAIPPEAVSDYSGRLWKKFADLALRDEDVRPWAIQAYGELSKKDPTLKKRLDEIESGHEFTDVELRAYEAASSSMRDGRPAEPGMPHPKKSSFVSKVLQVSKYAATAPVELTAEYWTAVSLGYMKRDKDMDEMCIAAHMPLPKERKGRAKK